MKGVPSIIKIKKGKPSEEVMNFFEKKTYNMPKKNVFDIQYPQVKQVKLFEFEGKYDVEDKMLYDDENINQAIEFRENKQRHTDFFFKLHELRERIEVFKNVFGTKTPKFVHENQNRVNITIFLITDLQKSTGKIIKKVDSSEHLNSILGSPGTLTNSQSQTQFFKQPFGTQMNSQKTGFDQGKRKSNAYIKGQSLESLQGTTNKRMKTDTINKKQQKQYFIKEEDEESLSNQGKDSKFKNYDQSYRQKQNPLDGIKSDKTTAEIQNSKEQKISQQNINSIDKAIELEKKKEQSTNQRLMAIEKKMPTIHSKEFKLNSLLNYDKKMNKEDSNLKNKVETRSIIKYQNAIMNEQQNKIVAQSDFKEGKLNIEQKTLVQSQTYADFKHHQIKIKKNLDKSLLIKSVYEHNLYKEASPKKKKPLKACHELDIILKKKQQKSPSLRESGITQQVNQLPEVKKGLHISSSTPQLNQLIPDIKIKQIQQVYNSFMYYPHSKNKKKFKKNKKEKKDLNNSQPEQQHPENTQNKDIEQIIPQCNETKEIQQDVVEEQRNEIKIVEN